jgi:hypothetical protein
MHTLSKLDEPADYQAAVVATRTLFEIAVDMTLIHFDPNGHPIAKLVAWEDSAKLKAALKIRDFFTGRGQVPSAEHDGPVWYINSHSARVQALRVQYWPGRNGNGHHPPRWTDRNLDDDASEATRLFPEGQFEEFYDTRYQQLCWMVHGSGILGLRFLPPEEFPALSALALRDCARFSLLASEVALRRLALWNEATVAEFDELRHRCVVVKHRIFFPERYQMSGNE